MPKVDIPFSLNRRPRGALIQVGSTRLYQRRPNYSHLQEYENAVCNDPTLSAGLQVIIETLLSMAGDVIHPDPEIQDFCRYSLEQMEFDWRRRFEEAVHTAFWAGCSVSEVLFKQDKKGNLVHDDIMCYHPSTILLRVNRRGRLTEGEPAALEGHTSGIYQMAIEPSHAEQLLPRWKSIYLVHNPRHNNVYGQSLIQMPYKYHLLKETYEEMMTTALDRYGHPLLWVKVAAGLTDESVQDPMTGEERQLTVQEAVERDIQNLSGGNVLVFTQTGDIAPEVNALTTGNNIGETFLSAIRYCDIQINRSLLVPFIIMGDDSSKLTSTGGAERQMELFRTIMRSLFKKYLQPFSSQLFMPLLQRHYNRESASIPPSFLMRQVTRSEERTSMMQMIVGLTEAGYFNPKNDEDWGMVRQFVDANERDKDAQDKKYIHDMVVGPRLKSSSSGDSEDGIKRGKPGRPKGSSAPQMNPR